MKFKLGQKVQRYNPEDEDGGIIGYLVAVSINPGDEEAIDDDPEEYWQATIRFFAPHLINGYADFYCFVKDLREVKE